MTKPDPRLAGRWKSNWGPVTLEIDGDKFKGSWNRGTFVAECKGNDLDIAWTHRDGTPGKAKLTFDDACNEMKGTWGFDKDHGEGDWTMTMAKRAPQPKTETPAAQAEGNAPTAKKPAAKKAAKKPAPAKAK